MAEQRYFRNKRNAKAVFNKWFDNAVSFEQIDKKIGICKEVNLHFPWMKFDIVNRLSPFLTCRNALRDCLVLKVS